MLTVGQLQTQEHPTRSSFLLIVKIDGIRAQELRSL